MTHKSVGQWPIEFDSAVGSEAAVVKRVHISKSSLQTLVLFSRESDVLTFIHHCAGGN